MDWGKTVRNLRARLNVNQAEFAKLAGVSQTYISRIEAGRVTPTPRVAEAILQLAENPQTRSVFDDFVASVRHSPYVCVLFELADENCRVHERSKGSVGVCKAHKGDPPGSPWLENVRAVNEKIIAAGGLHGAVDHAEALFKHHLVEGAFVRMVGTPIRDESGAWFIHCTFKRIDAEEHGRLLDEHGGETIALSLHQ
jgi:transcriptional regulator with XRE-family HTH domain